MDFVKIGGERYHYRIYDDNKETIRGENGWVDNNCNDSMEVPLLLNLSRIVGINIWWSYVRGCEEGTRYSDRYFHSNSKGSVWNTFIRSDFDGVENCVDIHKPLWVYMVHIQTTSCIYTCDYERFINSLDDFQKRILCL